MAEDRDLFRKAMRRLVLACPRAVLPHMEEAVEIRRQSVIHHIRPSFTLGGIGGGIAYNQEEFEDIVSAD